ncbi:MAG: tripartite tricarboxylate transporter TctB family protein [Deltaproteobacteria bacterium]|nr:tripartite tricarboxylate transporter TctB family protein [Deltaproteobacteria bacterium]
MVILKNKQDFLAGLIFVIIGVLGILLGWTLTVGTITRMGPGFLPRLLSYSMVFIGLIISLKSIRFGESTLERWKWRPMASIFGGILAFAFLISRGGLVLSIILVTILSSFGTHEIRWHQTLFLSTFMAGLSVLLFIYLLGLPLQVWPS